MMVRFDYFTLIIVLIILGSLSGAIIFTAYKAQIPARLELIKACRDEFGRRKPVVFCEQRDSQTTKP